MVSMVFFCVGFVPHTLFLGCADRPMRQKRSIQRCRWHRPPDAAKAFDSKVSMVSIVRCGKSVRFKGVNGIDRPMRQKLSAVQMRRMPLRQTASMRPQSVSPMKGVLAERLLSMLSVMMLSLSGSITVRSARPPS